MNPREFLNRYLWEDANYEKQRVLLMKEMLEKYFVPNTSLYKGLYPNRKRTQIGETIRGIRLINKEKPRGAEIITKIKGSKNTYRKYVLAKKIDRWYIKSMLLSCYFCHGKGKGCPHCHDGWI